MERDTFYVGAGVLVIRNKKILLGKRKNVYGAGLYGMPGGHHEHNENIAKAAARELFEETGMTAESFVFDNVLNYPFSDRHYLSLAFIAVNPKGEPENKEPDVCEGWKWFPLDNLPENLAILSGLNIKAYLENRNYSDSK